MQGREISNFKEFPFDDKNFVRLPRQDLPDVKKRL